MRIQEAMTGRIFSFGSSTEALSDTLTTYALATTIASIVPWPYVTLPSDQFEQLVTHVHTLSAWPTVWTSPLVENVPRWEAYSVKKVPDDYPRSEFIFSYGEDGKAPVNGNRTFAPIHQISHNLINPETNESLINYDIFTEPGLKPTFDFVQAAKHSQLSGFINLTIAREAVMDLLADEPLSLMVQPVFHSFENKTVSAFVQSIVQWSFVFANILEENEGAYCIVKPDCGEESITIKITGNSSVYLGMGDQRLEAFDKHADEVALLISENPLSVGGEGSCQYTVTIYPSEELHAAYDSSKAQIYTAIIGAVFFLMAATFFSYDR